MYPCAYLCAVAGIGDGYELVARSLAALGVKLAYGVVGIPVTPLASSLQAAGIRFIGMRNEQAAGYAAAASGEHPVYYHQQQQQHLLPRQYKQMTLTRPLLKQGCHTVYVLLSICTKGQFNNK
jgi:hypothetical protein